MNNQQDRECFNLLDTCIHIVAAHYGKADISTWTNRDYLLLSGQLFKQTNVQISASTLKRLFGKMKTAERYYPQLATRNTLAAFAGFSNWDSFVQAQTDLAGRADLIVTQEEIIESPLSSNPVNLKNKRSKISNTLLGIGALLLMAIIIFKLQKSTKNISIIPKAQLICSKTNGTTPLSAVFKINIPNGTSLDSSKFMIDYGDGHRDQGIIPGKLFTHYYEVPGRFYAVLKYNEAACDTVAIYLTTNGWTATANMQHDTTRVYPINLINSSRADTLKVTPAEVYYAGVDTLSTFFVNFVNTQPLDINGDNFELTVKLTTSHPRPGVRCSQANLTLFGERSQDMAILIKPGCVSWSELNFSEIKYSGTKADLSYLGADFESGGTVRLKVLDKHVQLYIKNVLAFNTTYKYPLKKIYGISIAFSGIGSIEGLLLKDLKTGKSFDGGLPIPAPTFSNLTNTNGHLQSL